MLSEEVYNKIILYLETNISFSIPHLEIKYNIKVKCYLKKWGNRIATMSPNSSFSYYKLLQIKYNIKVIFDLKWGKRSFIIEIILILL